jgi:hypothetical protein
MQRKLIKVGGTYALTTEQQARRRNRYYDTEAVKATVVALDAEYEKRQGRFGTLSRMQNDGILVKFDRPVSTALFGLKHVKDGVLELTITDPRAFLKPWDEYEAEEKAGREMEKRWAREADEAAAAFAPVLEATMKALSEHGFKEIKLYGDLSGISFYGGSVPLETRKGTDGKKKIMGFGYRDVRLGASDFARLLGIEYSDPDDEEGSDDE